MSAYGCEAATTGIGPASVHAGPSWTPERNLRRRDGKHVKQIQRLLGALAFLPKLSGLTHLPASYPLNPTPSTSAVHAPQADAQD